MAINVVTFSASGGAGNVAHTLVEGFSRIGLEANLLTAVDKNLWATPFKAPALTAAAMLDEYVLKSRTFDAMVSIARDNYSALSDQLPLGELNIFRWMNGLLGERFLRQNPDLGKLVWGLDDMNPFTGGCHYSGPCDGFESSCNKCPAVRPLLRAHVGKNLKRKEDFIKIHRPTFVAPTAWMQAEFERAGLAHGEKPLKILNPLPTRFFESKPLINRTSTHLKVIIIATNLDDRTKGVWNIKDTLNESLDRGNFELTLIGRHSQKLLKSLARANFLGSLDPQSVMEVLTTHDLLLVPSLFENAGTVVAEAASQGIPSLARDVGGMAEMTNYEKSGYLFRNETELADIIGSVTKAELQNKGVFAREWAQKLKPELVAKEYAEAFL